MSDYLIRAGESAHDQFSVDLPPSQAGWTYSGLQVINLAAGESLTLDTSDYEYLVLPLNGSARVEVGSDTSFTLAGRSTIWGQPSDYAYIGASTSFTLTSPGGGRFALPHARTDEALPASYHPVESARIELRGAGVCSRQVINYALNNPLVTSRLLVCEVLTPGGNWSSYPPHKHDEESDTECALEEIYYFEIRGNDHGPGFAFHSTYGTPDRPIEVAARVSSGDVALVPHGWHGPCVAAPGYDLYYLNVMAGPGGPTWKSVDDPCFAWVRTQWPAQEIDPRLPMPVKEA